ncbi:hypothetical protein CC80DRAFT_590646 [Byssothecium circinans]|uniref:Clr5 domain-containing protein n=1 Tax=Byssothecium circinans TaxID=147558 RepID=A0A6A5U980_9PLEO|nr:hypothetical protein CC80DRAFT_590646 [Byssothecium circinans]
MSPPTPAEWDAIRPIFTELYERLSLKDVQTELETRGFHASERMYRTRIKHWRLGKNKKDEVLRGTREHEAQGETTSYSIRSVPIPSEEVHEFSTPEGIDRSEVNNFENPRSRMPRDMIWSTLAPSRQFSCGTDEPSYVEQRDQLLDLLGAVNQNCHASSLIEALRRLSNKIPKEIAPQRWEKSWTNCVRSIQQHYTPLSSQFWTLGTLESDEPQLYPSITFGSLFFKYHNMRTLGDQEAAVATIDAAFGMARPLLMQPDPRLLIYFLESIEYTRARGYNRLATYMILHFALEARTALGLNHPITVFMASLHQSDDSTLDRIVEVGIRCIIDQFCFHIGGEHVETMRLLLTASMILKHQRAFDEAFNTLETLIAVYQMKYGLCSYQVCHALVDQAYVKIEQVQYDEATELLNRAMELLDGVVDWNERIESRVRCQVCFAAVSGARGNFVHKRDYLQLALETGRVQLGDEHWMMRDARASLVTVSSHLNRD